MVSLHIETARFKSPGHKNELLLFRDTLIWMLDLSIIEVTFTTMSPRLISSAARLKACSFSLVIPKIRSSSILIFFAIFAHPDVVVHLAYHQLLPIWMSVTLLTVEGE